MNRRSVSLMELAMVMSLVLTLSTPATAQGDSASAVLAAAKQVAGLIDRLADTGTVDEDQLYAAWRALHEAEARVPPEVKKAEGGGGPPKGLVACDVMLANAENYARLRDVQRAHALTQAATQCYAGVSTRPPRTFLPRIVASREADSSFVSELDTCLEVIRQQAAADAKQYRDSPISRLLNFLGPIPITIHPGTVTQTWPSRRGEPVRTDWNPAERGPFPQGGHYPDGASDMPCAALLHELTHGWEFYTMEDPYKSWECEAVRIENWLIWRLHGHQRESYTGDTITPLIVHMVVWPQARTVPGQDCRRE